MFARFPFSQRIVRHVFPLIAGLSATVALAQTPGKIPAEGDAAPGFRLPSSTGQAVRLAELTKQGPVVLVVLRGYPGYQCPACNAQTGQFFGAAGKFQAAKSQVVFVYPGQGAGLARRAGEFLQGKTVPEGMHVVLDPDYAFTNLYGLRWNKAGETAYPATFVIDGSGKVRFAKVSRSHGGRTGVEETLKALGKL